MGRPQLGFPRLRFASGRATGIAIGPDHTPPWVTVRQNPRTGGAWFAGAVSVEMHHTGDAKRQRDVVAIVEHVLADRPSDHVSPASRVSKSAAGSTPQTETERTGEMGVQWCRFRGQKGSSGLWRKLTAEERAR